MNVDNSYDPADSSSSDEGRMQIDESAGRSDDDTPKNIVQPPSVFETLKENDDEEVEEIEEEEEEEDESGEEDDDDDDGDEEDDDGDDDEDEEDEESEEDEEWEEYEEDVDASLPASLTVDSDIGDEDPCPICLNRLRDQDQGTPESCDHHFCLECIQEWAKNVNTCPVDRQVFRLILARRPGEDSVYKRIPIEDRNTQAEETEDELTYCEVCGRCDREDRLLLCDGCDLGYHLDCLSPPLADVPVDEWFCSDCAAANRGSTTITSEEEEEIVVRPPRRLIARTLVSERVRSLIQQTRMERARRRVIVSSSEDEAETSSKTPTPKKPPVKRRIIKRRRRKRKSVKKSTKTGVKTKRRKRKTRRKKTRKGGKRRKVRRLSARQPVVTTVKSRIAGKLGLSKPPVGLSIPLQKLPTGKTIDMQRAEIGISPFSILGHKDDLGPVYQDENVSEDRQPGTSSSCPTSSRVVKYSKSSLRSHKPVFRSKIIAASTERASNPSTTIVAPSMSSGAPFDILGSIMHGQSFLHMQSKDVTIHKDGSLIPNKEVPEAKVPESKDNVFELNTFKKNIADEDTKVGESLTSPIKPFRISKPKKPGASFKTTDRDYLAVFGIQDMDENSQEKAKESEYDPSQPTDDADALQQDDASGQSPEESALQKNSDEPSKLPMHSDISDDDSSSEKRVVVEKDSSLMIELSCTGDSTPDSQNSLSRRQVYEDGENEVEVPMEKEAEDEKASFEDGEIVRTEEESHDSLGKWSVGSDESALEKEYQMRMHEFAQLTRKEKKVRRRMEADQVEDGEESVFDRLNFGEYDARAYRTREKNESRRKRRKEKEERKEKLSSLHDSKEISKVHEDVKSDREIYEESRCDDKEEVYVYEESEIVSEKKEKKRSKHNRLEQYVYESDSHVKHKHRREKSRSQSRSREKVRTRSHSKDRYRTRSRSREKHDSRSRSRVRHRSRSRSREKRRSHSRERRHARSHDRSRRKKRERERERSGSRERSEERERSSRKKKRDRDRDRDHERERERSRERIERKGWRSRTPSDSPSPIKHSDKDSLNKENRHYHKRKSLKLDDYNDYPVIEKVKKAKPLETTKPHFERTMKVIEHTCNCHDPIVIDDDDDEEDVVEDSVIFGSIGVNLEDIPTPPAKKDTLPPPLAKTNQPTPPKKDVASKTVEGDGKIPTIIDQKIQPSTKHDSSGKNKAKQKKIPTIVDKVASDVDVSTMVLEVDEEMHNYDPAHPTDEEIEKEILKYDQLHHHPSANLDIALPPLPRNSPNVADNRMQFSSAEAGNIPLPPGSTLPQITPLPPNPSLPAVSFNMLPRVPTSIAQRPMLGNPLLMNRPVSFQSLPTMPPQGPPPQFGWPVNSTQVMSIQNQFGPPIMSRPPVMSVMPQAMLNGGLEEIPPESDSLFARNAPINNSTNLPMNMNNSTNVPMNLNPMNQMNVGSRGHSPRPTDTRPSAHKILASTNSKESEKQALPIQQLQSISTLLKVHACLTGKNSKRDGVFKIPQPVSGSKQKSRENEDPLDSMEMIDMDLSPLDEECELVLPTPPESMGKSKRSRKSKHKSVKALVSQQDDMPSSAADLTNKEKYLKKLHLQERVVDEVKCAIKPYYSSKKITKDEYKEILRKAVPKVCHSKAGEINPMKIKSLVEAYVTKFCKNRQGGKKTKKDDSKANGMKSKASR